MVFNKRKKLPQISTISVINYAKKLLKFSKYRKKKLILNRSDNYSFFFKKEVVYVPQGITLVRVNPSPVKTGFKLGEFANTKKPFNFRPKKAKVKR